MGPVIEWVTKGVRNGFGPFYKLIPVAGISGNIHFIHPNGPHCSPLIVVPRQPHLGQIGKIYILGYLLWIKMAMIINDRHGTGIIVIEPFGCRIFQQEIFIKELFHIL
jgi:hypothetical protein